MNWKTFAGRIWTRINGHDLWGRAAQLSFYFLMALFPLLLFLMALLGYFVQSGSELRTTLMTYLTTILPGSAATLVRRTLDEISQAGGGAKLSLGLLAAIWAASSGMVAITETLNAAYDLKETRSWWRVRGISIVLTIALSVMIMIALAVVLVGGLLGDNVAEKFGFSRGFAITFNLLRWPFVLLFLTLTFDFIYHFAPDGRRIGRRWWTLGAVTAVVLWVLGSSGFRLYLHYFDSYSVTYGSLGALIVLMLWFYVTSLAILIGGEINSELERSPAQA